MLSRYFVFLSVPLLLSAFTHLWNPIGFPFPNVDEGIYLGRAVNFMDTLNPRDPYIGYDHPYFGQIFLAGYLYITGYQSFLNSSYNYLNYEMLLLIPRILMAVLAILDTFLLFKIVEIRYSTKTAFIASILFAVMPITWLTRWILLDSIQLPFILLSILFAILHSNSETTSKPGKNVLLVLLSGTFLGVSIFTKIPSFTMIPFISYLVFTENRKNFKILMVWLMPVLLIPSLWPLHAISVGEFDDWLDAINNQIHRESHTVFIAFNDFFNIDKILPIIGISGLIYALIKRDLFILLSAIPLLIFMYFIGYVVVFQLLLLIVILCISSAKLFIDILSYVRKKNLFLHLLSIGGIAVIVVVGLTITIEQIALDANSQYFKAAHYIDQYLESDLRSNASMNENNNGGISTVSHPFFFWVDKYKFHNKNHHYWNEDKFENQKIISILDRLSKQGIEKGHYSGEKFRNLFSAFDTTQLMSFNNNSLHDSRIDILLTDLNRYNETKINFTNVLDDDYVWTNSKYTHIQPENGIINITVDTTKANKTDNVNRAFLKDTIDLSESAVYLSISYFIPSYGKGSTFTLEIIDSENNNIIWNQRLKKIQGITEKEFFILPENISGKKINLDIRIHSYEKGIDSLILKKLSFYY